MSITESNIEDALFVARVSLKNGSTQEVAVVQAVRYMRFFRKLTNMQVEELHKVALKRLALELS